MANVKLAIVYYSATGTNYQMAQWAEEAATAAGAEVKLRKVHEMAPEAAINSNPAWKANYEATKDVPEATSDDLVWADAILFSTATRFGAMAAQMKEFLDMQGGLWANGSLINKVASVTTSAQNPHGGQEASVLSFYTSLFHFGMIIAAPGYTDAALFGTGGNPYGSSATVNGEGQIQNDVKTAIEVQVKRMIDIAGRLKSGQ